MKNLVPALLLAVVAASACSRTESEVWVTTETTHVYASQSDIEDRVLFVLAPGDACVPLRSVIQKAYLHTEIQCGNRRGWVIDKQNFDVRRAR